MPGNEIQCVVKAVGVLELMARTRRAMSLREIAGEMGLAKSSAHRLLATLRGLGLVEQSRSDGRYALGLHLFELGGAVDSAWHITELARPYLQRVAGETGESVCLSLLHNGEALILDFMESPSAFHVVTRIGATLPVHCTVQGKVLLAYQSGAEVKRILRARGMRAYTPHTICTFEALAAELEAIRAQGYAVCDGEFHVGLTSVAAPIRGGDGRVSYALSVVSMFCRAGSPAFVRARELVLEAAGQISAALGSQGREG